MKPRHRWPLLLFVPSVAAAVLIALAAGPAMALLPWLAAGSDGAAPLSDNALMAIMAGVFLAVLVVLLALARRLGKRREQDLPPPPE